jgi:hypothetical protein
VGSPANLLPEKRPYPARHIRRCNGRFAEITVRLKCLYDGGNVALSQRFLVPGDHALQFQACLLWKDGLADFVGTEG